MLISLFLSQCMRTLIFKTLLNLCIWTKHTLIAALIINCKNLNFCETNSVTCSVATALKINLVEKPKFSLTLVLILLSRLEMQFALNRHLIHIIIQIQLIVCNRCFSMFSFWRVLFAYSKILFFINLATLHFTNVIRNVNISEEI